MVVPYLSKNGCTYSCVGVYIHRNVTQYMTAEGLRGAPARRIPPQQQFYGDEDRSEVRRDNARLELKILRMRLELKSRAQASSDGSVPYYVQEDVQEDEVHDEWCIESCEAAIRSRCGAFSASPACILAKVC